MTNKMYLGKRYFERCARTYLPAENYQSALPAAADENAFYKSFIAAQAWDTQYRGQERVEEFASDLAKTGQTPRQFSPCSNCNSVHAQNHCDTE